MQYCTVIWLCGVALLTLRVAFQNILFSHRAASAQEITEPDIQTLLQQCKDLLHLTSRVKLLETDLVKSPALYGLFRPRLLLPLGFAHNFNTQELRCIFLHELAHLKRRDVLLQWLVTILQILHWFNPLLWYGFRRMASDREMACDELALSAAGNVEASCYGETIIKVLENCSRPQTLPGLVGILESKEQMTRRISRIAAFRRTRRWSLSATLLLIALALVGLTGAQTQKSQPTPGTTPNPNPTQPKAPQMNFIALDADTGKPLPGTKLRIGYSGPGTSKGEKGATGSDGTLLIEPPKAPYDAANIFVTAQGHVPIVINMRTGQEWPAEYILKLKPGKTVAGLVQDSAGHPIEGAKIKFVGRGIDMAKAEHIQFGSDTDLLSDAGGKWISDMVPKEYDTIGVMVTHPEFAPVQTNLPASGPKEGDVLITLSSGVTIAGLVTDRGGKPVRNATVRDAKRDYQLPKRTAQTDGQGAFELAHLEPGEISLVAQANGFAPRVLTTNIAGERAELTFRLNPGKLLRVKVTDEAGNAIPDAKVRTAYDNLGFGDLGWTSKTDKDGRVEWGSAPEERISYSVEAPGRLANRQVLLSADGTEQVVKLQKPVRQAVARISGTAVDADTAEGLQTFEVVSREVRNPEWPEQFMFGAHGKNGHFKVDLSERPGNPAFQLQIQSEGYLPVLSTNLYPSNGNQTVEFKLHKGTGPSGKVITAGDVPVVDAKVFMCQRRTGVTMQESGKFEKGLTYADTATTDSEGRFSFKPKIEVIGFIVIHANGYAESSVEDLKSSGKIQLQPWGRVQGKLYFNHQPAPNETVHLQNVWYRYPIDGRDFPLNLYYATTTDAQGNFVFDKVPAGYRKISHRLNTPESNSMRATQPTTVWVEPGKVTSVSLGGQGRPIIGKASLANPPQDLNWRNTRADLSLKFPVAPVPPQTRLRQSDFPSTEAFLEALKKEARAYKAFWMSEAGREIERNQKTYSTVLKADGSFEFQDIPAGTYELKLELKDLNPNNIKPGQSLFTLPNLAGFTNEVTVPPIPGGRTDQPLDLGVLELKSKEHAEKSVPNKASVTREGKPNLSASFSHFTNINNRMLFILNVTNTGSRAAALPQHLNGEGVYSGGLTKMRTAALSLSNAGWTTISAGRSVQIPFDPGWGISFWTNGRAYSVNMPYRDADDTNIVNLDESRSFTTVCEIPPMHELHLRQESPESTPRPPSEMKLEIDSPNLPHPATVSLMTSMSLWLRLPQNPFGVGASTRPLNCHTQLQPNK